MLIVTMYGIIHISGDEIDYDPVFATVETRVPADLLAHFPEAEVQITPGRDYLYRARLPRARVIEVITEKLTEAQYKSEHFEELALGRSARVPHRDGVMERLRHTTGMLQVPYLPNCTKPWTRAKAVWR